MVNPIKSALDGVEQKLGDLEKSRVGAYEALKQLTRTNEHVTQQTIEAFVDGLDVDEEVKSRIRAVTPSNYTGYACE